MNKHEVNDLLFETIYHAAQAKGAIAANTCNPRPMVVQQHANPMDNGSPVVARWDVAQGVCGFAWVVVRPGNSSFAN